MHSIMQQWIQIYTITTQMKSKIALLKPLFMVEWSNSMQLKKQTWHDTRRTICQVYLWPLFGNTWQQSGVKIMTNHTQKWRVVWWRCVLSPILFNCVCIHYYHMSCSFSDASYSRNDRTWMALARISMLCNRAEFKVGQENVPVLKRWATDFCVRLP